MASSLNWSKDRERRRMYEARRDDTSAALRRAARTAASPPTRPLPTVPQPVNIAQFPKNSSGEVVAVWLEDFQGRPFCDVRVWFPGPNGVLKRSGKGVFVSVHKLPELAAAIAKALKVAIELGLIEPAEGATGQDVGGTPA